MNITRFHRAGGARRALLALPVAACLLLLAGCGGDQNKQQLATPTVLGTRQPVTATPVATQQSGVITLCHATGSPGHPYELVTIPGNPDAEEPYLQDTKNIIPVPPEGCPGPGTPVPSSTPRAGTANGPVKDATRAPTKSQLPASGPAEQGGSASPQAGASVLPGDAAVTPAPDNKPATPHGAPATDPSPTRAVSYMPVPPGPPPPPPPPPNTPTIASMPTTLPGPPGTPIPSQPTNPPAQQPTDTPAPAPAPTQPPPPSNPTGTPVPVPSQPPPPPSNPTDTAVPTSAPQPSATPIPTQPPPDTPTGALSTPTNTPVPPPTGAPDMTATAQPQLTPTTGDG